MTNRAGIAPWALLLFWTGLILVADLVYGVTTLRQAQSTAFTQTTGKIAQSASGQGAMGRRGLRLRYSYSVNGVNYTGNRYRYDDANVSLRYLRVLDDFPAHSRHTIYYNPNNPRDSVLAPGVDGRDLLLFLVAMPFNVATFALWKLFLNFRRAKKPTPATDGIEVFREKDETRIRLAETSVFEAAVYGLGLASTATAAVVIAIWAFDEPMSVMIAVWASVLTTTIATALWKHVKNNSGQYDLCVASCSLTLPQIAARTTPLTIRRDDLKGVTVLRRASATPGGCHYSYLPALSFTIGDAPAQTLALVCWGWTEQRAVAFARWLGEELHAEFLEMSDEEYSLTVQHQNPPNDLSRPVPVSGHFGL